MDEPTFEFEAGWQSPSNIALVKYWGKTANQIPINPSLSMTLHSSVTRTSIRAVKKNKASRKVQLKYRFEGEENIAFQSKVLVLLNNLVDEFPFLNEYSLEIDSTNTFPHSAGIASSASSMSALALCLLSIQEKITGKKMNFHAFYKKASHIARLGSGSASRSVYGNYVLWGKYIKVPKSGNLTAIPLPVKSHPLFSNLNDSILVIDQAVKPVSSRAGHEKMGTHFFRKGRIEQVNEHLIVIIKAIMSGDWDSFSRVVENEAFTLHALMMSSDPGFTLMQPATLKAIEKLASFRSQYGVKITFTLDAGPNLHLLYPDENKANIQDFIKQELAPLCTNNYVIHDRIGSGPVQIN
ncbi:MAG: diphosphomevalonate decarboxylase [Bacteroidales bacterium]|nr:diphosphomevalonate decarboxylase [Bacteroidales bacterium]